LSYALLLATTLGALTVLPTPFGLFSPGAGDPSNTVGASFTPDGHTVYYAKAQPGYTGLTIFYSKQENGEWSPPQVAPFSGIYRDTDPTVTLDGSAVIFASARPPGDGGTTYKLWIAYLKGPKAGSTEMLSPSINAAGSEGHPSVARDGTLYYSKSTGALRRLYRASMSQGSFGIPELLDIPGDTEQIGDIDPAIAFDQSFLVFSSNRADSLGGNDLYLSFHRDGHWCKPYHFEAPINSAAAEFAPELSSDARTLYFASTRTAVEQPRTNPATQESFKAELNQYAHGSARTYQVSLSSWLGGHRDDPCM